MGFPKNGSTLLGVPIIRIMVFGVDIGDPYLRKPAYRGLYRDIQGHMSCILLGATGLDYVLVLGIVTCKTNIILLASATKNIATHMRTSRTNLDRASVTE